jgi:hypothetical protein
VVCGRDARAPSQRSSFPRRDVGVRFAHLNLCGLGFASLGEGGVARRSRGTEGVGAESGREMTLAVFVAAATPSDSPSASHLPQEEGFVLRRFAPE